MSQIQMESRDQQSSVKVHTQAKTNDICVVSKDQESQTEYDVGESVQIETVHLEQSKDLPQKRSKVQQIVRMDQREIQSENSEQSVDSISQLMTVPTKTNCSGVFKETNTSGSPDTFQQHLLQQLANAENSSQQVQERERQITLKVLPQNITIKPTVQSVPTACNVVKIPTVDVPVLKSSPQNTAIIIRKDGGGQISNPTSAFVEEMIKRSGMKIVESQTRIVLRADDTILETSHKPGYRDQREIVETEGKTPPCSISISAEGRTDMAPRQLTSVQQCTRPQFLASQRPTAPGAPLSQRIMIRPPFAYQSPGANLLPNQTLPVCYMSRLSQMNVGQQQHPIPRPGGGTVGNFGQSPSINAPGINYIKVRLQGMQSGAQWILLPKCFASPMINSPPLPRKQPVSRDVSEKRKDFKSQDQDDRSRLSANEDSCAAVEQDIEGVGEEAMDTDEVSGVARPVDQYHDKTRRVNSEKEVTRINFNNEEATSGDIFSQNTIEGKTMQKSSENMTNAKSNHSVKPSASNLRERQDTSDFRSRTTSSSSPVQHIEGSNIIQTSKVSTAKNNKMDTCNDATLECQSKVFSSSTPHSTENIRIATATTCTSTLTYASLSPRCKTTYTSRASGADNKNLNENDPDVRDTCGQAVGDGTDRCPHKGLLSNTERRVPDNKDATAGPAGQASPLDGYTGPVDMYVYLPEKAFKKGSVTFLSLRK